MWYRFSKEEQPIEQLSEREVRIKNIKILPGQMLNNSHRTWCLSAIVALKPKLMNKKKWNVYTTMQTDGCPQVICKPNQRLHSSGYWPACLGQSADHPAGQQWLQSSQQSNKAWTLFSLKQLCIHDMTSGAFTFRKFKQIILCHLQINSRPIYGQKSQTQGWKPVILKRVTDALNYYWPSCSEDSKYPQRQKTKDAGFSIS